MERVAECHCGQLRAITSGEPDSVYVCHCKACQRRTGAIIHNGSRWLKSQVRIEGEHKTYGSLAASGFEIRLFLPKLRQQCLLGRRPQPDHLRHRRRLLCRPRFPATDLIRLGRVDAPLARTTAGHHTFPASSLLKLRQWALWTRREHGSRMRFLILGAGGLGGFYGGMLLKDGTDLAFLGRPQRA
jgi:hypothetical protein